MNFDTDAFISYAHLDNIELVEGRRGWVANLHRALEVRVAQLLGKHPHIWRDPKLSGNDFFAETLVQRLSQVAALISIVSPRYIRSEWTRRELSEFSKAAEQQGGVRVRDKARIFKVVKTPILLEQELPELQPLLGYEFFTVHPETGRVRELDEVFGPEAQREFWVRLDDLAHDICRLLEDVEHAAAPAAHAAAAGARSEGAVVFLAATTADLKEQHEGIRRDLQQHGHTVLPFRTWPLIDDEVRALVREDLARCEVSIHLVGRTYSVVPEGGSESLLEIQHELAIERANQGHFSRLVWIPAGLEVQDERQQRVLERLRMDSRPQASADLLETSLEDLRTIYQERLRRRAEPQPHEPEAVPVASGRALVYLMYDQRDVAAMPAYMDLLFQQGFEVVRPAFDGDEAELREYHEENLRTCDAALILYGNTGELWLRRKLREIQKSAGYGRTTGAPVVGICVLPPATAEKESLRTHDAVVIPQLAGLSADALNPFTSLLAG